MYVTYVEKVFKSRKQGEMLSRLTYVYTCTRTLLESGLVTPPTPPMQMTPCDLLSDDSSSGASTVSGDSIIHVIIPEYLKERALSVRSFSSSSVNTPMNSARSTMRDCVSLPSYMTSIPNSRSSTARKSLTSFKDMYQDDGLSEGGYMSDGSLPRKRKPLDPAEQLRDRLARTVAEVILAKLVLVLSCLDNVQCCINSFMIFCSVY